MNTGVMYLLNWCFWFFFFDILPREKFLGYMVVVVLVFWETSMFSIMTAPIYTPTSSVKDSLFSTLLPTFVVCRRLFKWIVKTGFRKISTRRKIRDKKLPQFLTDYFKGKHFEIQSQLAHHILIFSDLV